MYRSSSWLFRCARGCSNGSDNGTRSGDVEGTKGRRMVTSNLLPLPSAGLTVVSASGDVLDWLLLLSFGWLTVVSDFDIGSGFLVIVE